MAVITCSYNKLCHFNTSLFSVYILHLCYACFCSVDNNNDVDNTNDDDDDVVITGEEPPEVHPNENPRQNTRQSTPTYPYSQQILSQADTRETGEPSHACSGSGVSFSMSGNAPSGSGALETAQLGESSFKNPLDQLLTIFARKLPVKKVLSIFHVSGKQFDASLECLLSGPTLESITKLTSRYYQTLQHVKLYVDSDDAWADTVAFYKCNTPFDKSVRVRISDHPAVDTGGVRRQLYTFVFRSFAENSVIRLFDGPPNHLRPVYSAESRASDMFTVLGSMIGHSILQDGVGFPYLSPLCYWYIVSNDESKALQYVSMDDVGLDVAQTIKQVRSCVNIVNSVIVSVDFLSDIY